MRNYLRIPRIMLYLLLVTCSVTIPACRRSEVPGDSPTPTKVRIGYQALSSSWTFFVANERLPGREKSFFEEEGLDVEEVRFDSSNTAMEAMLSGQIATDSATTMTVLFNVEEKSPGSLKCFGFQMHTSTQFLESFIARKGSQIRGYNDLRGRKVGVFPGSLNTQITKLLVQSYMDPEKDVTIVQMLPPVQLQALTQGEVDALISYEPTTTLAVTKGVAEVVEHSPWAKHLFEPFPVAAYCFTSNYLDKQPDNARKIARAWARAMQFVKENPSVAAQTIPKYTGIPLGVAPRLNQPLQQTSAEVDRAAVRKLGELYLKFGVTAQPVKADEIYYQQP